MPASLPILPIFFPFNHLLPLPSPPPSPPPLYILQESRASTIAWQEQVQQRGKSEHISVARASTTAWQEQSRQTECTTSVDGVFFQVFGLSPLEQKTSSTWPPREGMRFFVSAAFKSLGLLSAGQSCVLTRPRPLKRSICVPGRMGKRSALS